MIIEKIVSICDEVQHRCNSTSDAFRKVLTSKAALLTAKLVCSQPNNCGHVQVDQYILNFEGLGRVHTYGN